jgi:CpXC protein
VARRPRKTYNPKVMSFQGKIEAACPSCAEAFEAPVWSFVHGEGDPALRDQIKARECNLLLCPSCGTAFMPETAWVYYEPGAEILAFVFPETWREDEARWREKMSADFAAMRAALDARLPADFEPEVHFGQDSLGLLLEREDWLVDERDVMTHYANELGLKVFKASPRWARASGAPADLPYKGRGKPTREALIAGLKALVAANDRLTAWAEFLARLEDDAGAGVPPAAAAR